jgi:RNA polymerase sigma factor (sigma-70 family)
MQMESSTDNGRTPTNERPRKIGEDLAATRSSLVGRLKKWDDQESWQVFFDTYWKLIYTVAIRAGLSDAEARDAVQETILAVAKAVKDFEYDRSKGSFRGWLMRWASWRIKDQFRKRSHGHNSAAVPEEWDGEGRTSVQDKIPDPQDAFARLWGEEWGENLRESVMRRVRAKVPPRQYQIFDCYVVKGWSVEQVTKELGVSKASVYLARTRVGRVARAETLRIENGLL